MTLCATLCRDSLSAVDLIGNTHTHTHTFVTDLEQRSFVTTLCDKMDSRLVPCKALQCGAGALAANFRLSLNHES